MDWLKHWKRQLYRDNDFFCTRPNYQSNDSRPCRLWGACDQYHLKKYSKAAASTPPPQQQHDRRRASTENNNNNNIRNDYGDSGLAGNIGGWLGRRWGIALRHFIHEGCNMDVNHMFFLLIPFIPFIILYLILKWTGNSQGYIFKIMLGQKIIDMTVLCYVSWKICKRDKLTNDMRKWLSTLACQAWNARFCMD